MIDIVLDIYDIICRSKREKFHASNSTGDTNDNSIMSRMVVFVEKLKYRSRNSLVSDTATTSSETQTIDVNDGSISFVYHQEGTVLLITNAFMIGSFMVFSSMMLLASGPEMKCILYASAVHIQYIVFIASLNVMFREITNIPYFTPLLLWQFIFFCAEKTRNIMFTFYGGNSKSQFIEALIVRTPSYIFGMLGFCYCVIYYYGKRYKNWDYKKHRFMFEFMRHARHKPALLYHSFVIIYLVVAVTLCVTLFPFDKALSDFRMETLPHMEAVNVIFVVYLVFVVTKNTRRKTEILEDAFRDLRDLNNIVIQEKLQYERTLCNLVPSSIAYDLCSGTNVEPRYHKNCCIFVSNIEGFDQFSVTSSPLQIFRTVDRLFHVMDTCLQQFATLYKVETRGDGYVVVGGLEIGMDTVTLSDFILFSFLVQDIVRLVPMDTILGSMVRLRCGISHGGLVSGVTGEVTPKFCIFGDAVQVAISLEREGSTECIHVSSEFAEYLNQFSLLLDLSWLFSLEKRSNSNNIEEGIRGKVTYWLKKGSTLDLKMRYSHCYSKVHEMVSNDKYAGFVKPA